MGVKGGGKKGPEMGGGLLFSGDVVSQVLGGDQNEKGILARCGNKGEAVTSHGGLPRRYGRIDEKGRQRLLCQGRFQRGEKDKGLMIVEWTTNYLKEGRKRTGK